MRTWWLPWLFPVGLLATVVFVVIAGRYVAVVAVALGVLLVPVLWRRHFDAPDAETSYWRTKLW